MKRTLEQGRGRPAAQQPFGLNPPNARTGSTPGATGFPGATGSVGMTAQPKVPTMASRPAAGDAFSLGNYEDMGELSFVSDEDSENEAPDLFSEKALKQRTELKVENDTSLEDLQTLRMALPSNTTITRLVLDGSYPEAAKAVLTALQTNITVKSLGVVCWQSCFDPKVLMQLTALLKKQTPLQSFELCIIESEECTRVFTLDQDFFDALFAHPHLETVRISCEHVDRVYLNNLQQLAARLRDNSKLKHLELREFKDFAILWEAIAPGLEGNRSVTSLDLRHNDLSGLAPDVASLLLANPAITSLDIQDTGWKAAELGVVIDAAARSTTLREFYFYRASEYANASGPDMEDARPALGEAIGKLLATNQHLESLGIQSKLDEANVVAIRQGLNANTSLRFFDPGEIRGANNPEGAADATDAINQLFATNSRLTSVMLRPPRAMDGGDGVNPTLGLKGMERNISVRSLRLKFTGDSAGVTSLLQNNRYLTSLTLVTERREQNPLLLARQLEAIFDAVTDNTTLLEFRLDALIPDDSRKGNIDLIVARFDALCGRNKRLHEQREQQMQRVSAPATGIGLLNEFRRNEDANWPALRSEEATAIASAIDTVLPQDEARRVLDVLRFADIRHG